jgi:hypothetical protein
MKVWNSSRIASADGIHRGATESTDEDHSFFDRMNRIDGMAFDSTS